MRITILLLTAMSALLLTGTTSRAALIPVASPLAFGAGSPTLTFAGIASGTEVNGLVVNGVSFAYSLGNGNVDIDGGPGITNNLNPPNIVSTGDNSGILTVRLPTSATMFGYGYAVLSSGTVLNATTISAFSGATPLGSLGFTGTPDPSFPGGFAGIQSTIAFDSLQLSFDTTTSVAFALDNLIYTTATPEPAAGLLVIVGFSALVFRLRTAKPRNQ